MTEESTSFTHKCDTTDGTHISRRHFLGAGVVVSAGAMTGVLTGCDTPDPAGWRLPDTLTSAGQVIIANPDEVDVILECGGLLPDDVQKAIFGAATERKGYVDKDDPAHFLIRHSIGNIIVYVDFTMTEDDTYLVHTVYAHTFEIVDYNLERKSNWTEEDISIWLCISDEGVVIHTSAVRVRTHDEVDVFFVAGLRCVECGWQILEEETAETDLAELAELMEAK